MDPDEIIENPLPTQTPLNWAKPDSTFDITTVTPHTCMADVIQYGPFIHCNTANHDMYIGPLKMLDKIDGKFTIVDIVVH